MIPGYRMDDGMTEQRKLALLCLIHHNITLNKSAYEFCDHVVTEGYLNNIETNEEGMQRHGGDIVSFASEKLMKHFHTWQDTHEKNNNTKSD
jgi:hypothetical protein|tara:strand:- start:1680 stop:1955 length:276 start_codon:yes stop_codon:yes gene_type:complete